VPPHSSAISFFTFISDYLIDDHKIKVAKETQQHNSLDFNDASSSAKAKATTKLVTAQMFSCTRCQRQYKFRKTLNRHMNYECGKDKEYLCSLCDYRTHRNDRLLSHKRLVHPDVAPLRIRGSLPKIVNIESISYQKFSN